MADQQQQSTGAPAIEIPTTPEAATARIAELQSDKGWVEKFLAGDLAVRRENDRLLTIAAGGSPQAEPQMVTTPAQAKSRLDELNTDAAWRRKFFDGDLATKKEFDRLTEISAQVPEGTTEASKTLTAAEARAAALDAVPDKPEDYGELPFRHDDMPPPEGITEIQGLMHTAGLTRGEAQTMVAFAANDLVKWGQMDEVARTDHLNDTRARFHKIHGDQAPAMEAGARRLIAEITAKDGGRLRQILLETGAGASLAVWNALAAAASRRYDPRPSGVTPKRRYGG